MIEPIMKSKCQKILPRLLPGIARPSASTNAFGHPVVLLGHRLVDKRLTQREGVHGRSGARVPRRAC
jgi:hypothetical protein